MKKLISLILALCLALGAPGVCLAEEQPTQDGVTKYGLVGRLSKLNVEESTLNEALKEFWKDAMFTGVKFYDSLSSMLMALLNGDIGFIYTDEHTARYIAARNEKMVARRYPDFEYTLSFALLLRDTDRELCDQLSKVIREMKEDGTVEELRRRYMDSCAEIIEPEAVYPKTFDDARTIRVAVTGDRPPMDYISGSGFPVGFNTALMAEAASRLGINLRFVSVDSAARSLALSSGDANVVFWMEEGNFNDWENATGEDMPEGTVATEPYMQCRDSYLVLRSSPLADLLLPSV